MIEGLQEQTPNWHFKQFAKFTKYKINVMEPTPQLAMIPQMVNSKDRQDRVWALACFTTFYCLPTAHLFWEEWPFEKVLRKPEKLNQWLIKNWKGIATRAERRCIRSIPKMHLCLINCAAWVDKDYLFVLSYKNNISSKKYLDKVWESVTKIPFFGRYASMRFIEGLNRFCKIPALFYDIRAKGGWSPKEGLIYFYPKKAESLFTDDTHGNLIAEHLATKLLIKTQQNVSSLDYYILETLLCEYRKAFTRNSQYPGRTIDSEVLYYEKLKKYWGNTLNEKLFWETRAALFPHKALGEFGGWHGTRDILATTLRDFGYIWSDLKYDYAKTLKKNLWKNPVRR